MLSGNHYDSWIAFTDSDGLTFVLRNQLTTALTTEWPTSWSVVASPMQKQSGSTTSGISLMAPATGGVLLAVPSPGLGHTAYFEYTP